MLNLLRRTLKRESPEAAIETEARAAARRRVGPPTFEDMSVDFAELDDSERPQLDRVLKPGAEAALDPQQRFWRDNGYLVLEKFMPDELIDAYCKVRAAYPKPGGWGPTPYLYHDELKDFCLYRPLVDVLEKLLGDQVILHLNLTGWVSTQRDWHQDDFLNPPCVKGHYLAIWAALDDIHPDCGPYEFIPGSHRWRVLSREKVKGQLPPEQAIQEGPPKHAGHWIGFTEKMVSDASVDYIKRMGGAPQPFLGKRGDVLIWHGCLLHRGSFPKVPGMQRKALIAHYSGRKNRLDFDPADTRTYEKTGGLYQYFDRPLSYD